MPDERFRTEEIVNNPRHAGVAFGRRSTLAAVCRLQRTTDGRFFRWRKEYGGIWGRPGEAAEGARPENVRLRQLLAFAELD